VRERAGGTNIGGKGSTPKKKGLEGKKKLMFPSSGQPLGSAGVNKICREERARKGGGKKGRMPTQRQNR